MKRSIFYCLILFLTFFACIPAFAEEDSELNQYIINPNEVIFNQSQYMIDVIDPQATTNTKGANYPGLRGANQLVIYTPNFGFRTNTNEFGTEAIVEGNTVTSLSGADSLIPAGGFVISGHGSAKKWINENLMVGAKVYINPETKTIDSYITSETFLFGAKERIKEVQNLMTYYKIHNPYYNQRRTEQSIEKAESFIQKAQRNSENAQKYASRAIEYADSALTTVIPYDYNELKGVWIRPTYFTVDEIVNVLNRIADAGINNVFIETYYHGQTIFPSKTMEKYGFLTQNPLYAGFDPLRIWIVEAHKRGIKVHIWFESFYVGNKSPEVNPKYILAQKPEWANYQKKNIDSETIPYSVSEHNGYFLDPANPEVQDFLCELIQEIVLKYRPDGINLDYIRYPQSLTPNFSNYDMSNWGYTKYAREDFQKMFGIDPIEINTTDSLWYFWKSYRAGKVTDFVRRVGEICRKNNTAITAVIFPNKELAFDTKLQDWSIWSYNNFIDGFTPLFLTCDDKTALNLMGNIINNKSPRTKLYAGLFVTFMNGANSDLIKQIHAARTCKLNGLIIFDYAHLKDNYINTLTESIFRPLAQTRQQENRRTNYRDGRR